MSLCCGVCRIYDTYILQIDLSFRLVGGQNVSSGRIKIFADGLWGTMCKNTFNKCAADMGCRSLGFSYVQELWLLICSKISSDVCANLALQTYEKCF